MHKARTHLLTHLASNHIESFPTHQLKDHSLRHASRVSHPFRDALKLHYILSSCLTTFPRQGLCKSLSRNCKQSGIHTSRVCSWGHSRRYFFLLFGFDARHAGSYDSLGEVYLHVLFTNLAIFAWRAKHHAFRDSWRHLNQDQYFTQNHPNWPPDSLWVLGKWLWLSFIFPSFWR